MTSTALILHRGARVVSREELDAVQTPEPTATWFPIPHSKVLDATVRALNDAGFAVADTKLGLARDHHQFFGTLDLVAPVAQGVRLAVGIRNSIDKSLPIAFCAGNRVFVCDNLSFNSEVVVSRKHTRWGSNRYVEGLCKAVQTLTTYREAEARRIERWQQHELNEVTADALLLRAYERGAVSTLTLPKVIKEWREPSYAEFKPRTLWSLFNAFTTVIGDRQRTNPQAFAAMTMQLHGLLSGQVSVEDAPPTLAV